MAIDRAARVRRREHLRATHRGETPGGEAGEQQPTARAHAASATLEVEGLFNAGVRHRLDQLEWVAVAKEDDRVSGAGPLDLESGVVRISPAGEGG